MAGQPRKRAMRDDLDRRTREFFDGEEGRTPLDYAECLVASGTSIRKLAAKMTAALGFDVNRETLRRYLETLDPENYAARMKTAQEHGASAYAEDSIDVLDDATPEEASLAAAKSRARQWIAEKWNARDYGRAAGPAVVLNVGQLMLQALQQPLRAEDLALVESKPLTPLGASAPTPLGPLALTAPSPYALTVDAEIVSVEGASD